MIWYEFDFLELFFMSNRIVLCLLCCWQLVSPTRLLMASETVAAMAKVAVFLSDSMCFLFCTCFQKWLTVVPCTHPLRLSWSSAEPEYKLMMRRERYVISYVYR